MSSGPGAHSGAQIGVQESNTLIGVQGASGFNDIWVQSYCLNLFNIICSFFLVSLMLSGPLDFGLWAWANFPFGKSDNENKYLKHELKTILAIEAVYIHDIWSCLNGFSWAGVYVCKFTSSKLWVIRTHWTHKFNCILWIIMMIFVQCNFYYLRIGCRLCYQSIKGIFSDFI